MEKRHFLAFILFFLSLTAFLAFSSYTQSESLDPVPDQPDPSPHWSRVFVHSTTPEVVKSCQVASTEVSNETRKGSFLEFVSRTNWTTITTQKLVNELVPFIIAEPRTSPRNDCFPPNLPNVTEQLCSEDRAVFTGEVRLKPANIVHAVKLGFDVDTLEIHLNELFDVIDYFIITESVISHKGTIRKPLIWELIRLQPRFAKFESKIIHLVLDDEEIVQPKPESGIFGSERLQELRRWEKIQLWNQQKKFLGPNDLISFGDADEIASRENFHKARHCKLKLNQFDVGIWFAFGTLNTAFQSDFPVKDLSFTLGNPTFYTYSHAEAVETYPTYKRGTSPGYLLGGAHLTDYQYVPFLLSKWITATEAGGVRRLSKFIMKELSSQTDAVAAILSAIKRTRNVLPASRFESIGVLREDPVYARVIRTPWFLYCNPERYPAWFGNPDPRLT